MQKRVAYGGCKDHGGCDAHGTNLSWVAWLSTMKETSRLVRPPCSTGSWTESKTHEWILLLKSYEYLENEDAIATQRKLCSHTHIFLIYNSKILLSRVNYRSSRDRLVHFKHQNVQINTLLVRLTENFFTTVKIIKNFWEGIIWPLASRSWMYVSNIFQAVSTTRS